MVVGLPADLILDEPPKKQKSSAAEKGMKHADVAAAPQRPSHELRGNPRLAVISFV